MGGGDKDRTKRAFDLQRFAQVDNPYEFDIDNNKLVDIDTQRTLVNLSRYARNNIANYETITSIPQENIEYLSSGLSASNCSRMFYNCRQLTSIPWNEFNIDTSQCTDMTGMFYECDSLTNLDLSKLNTSKVNNMNDMFHGCNSLTNLNLSNFNTSNVINMSFMFNYCSDLTSLDLSNFDTSQVTNMFGMFQDCNGLEEIICTNGFDLSSCTNVNYMFSDCTSYIGEPLHFKNVPRDLSFSFTVGTKGKHYVIDNYKD